MVGCSAHAHGLGTHISSVQLPVRFFFFFFFFNSIAPMDDVNSGREMARCKWVVFGGVVPYHHTLKHHAAHAY